MTHAEVFIKMELRIDSEFRSLIPPLTSDERTQLEDNIFAEGCRDPLVVWQGPAPLCEQCDDGTGWYVVVRRSKMPTNMKTEKVVVCGYAKKTHSMNFFCRGCSLM